MTLDAYLRPADFDGVPMLPAPKMFGYEVDLVSMQVGLKNTLLLVFCLIALLAPFLRLDIYSLYNFTKPLLRAKEEWRLMRRMRGIEYLFFTNKSVELRQLR